MGFMGVAHTVAESGPPPIEAGAAQNADALTMKVFVGGSRRLSRLPAEVQQRLDAMIDKGFQILVGDANGADKAIQRYLLDKAYSAVLIHYVENDCRNNVGHWPTREVVAPPGARGFDYFSAKDRAMAEAADYGLMLWDGRSKGTINNVVNLARRGKVVVVYVGPTRSFQTVRSFEDLSGVLEKGDPSSVSRLVTDLRLHRHAGTAAG